MKKMFSIRGCNTLGFLACIGLFMVAAYFQYHKGLAPCPLCQLQRMVLGVVAFVFLMAALHHPGRVGTKLYGLLIFLVSSVGALLAGRQVWLQAQPAGSTQNCAGSLDYMLHTLPFNDAMLAAVQGTGDCAQVDWQFLGLSMAAWMLLIFVGFGLLGASHILRTKIK